MDWRAIKLRAALVKKIFTYATSMRRNRVPAEQKMFGLLRAWRIEFKTQVVIGHYIADFVIDKLVIELDGPTHVGREQYDRERDAYLRKSGCNVMRFPNRIVYEDPRQIKAEIFKQYPMLQARAAIRKSKLFGRWT